MPLNISQANVCNILLSSRIWFRVTGMIPAYLWLLLPFGHASQEIVNLLLCGQAVPNVGQFLKSPKWPIWVVGSESHYTVLFALDPSVQNENELEGRETQIRKAFDAQDQSGGGGFISVEGFHQVLKETNIKLPPEKLEHLCSAGFIVWSEFWQVILDLDKSLGGLKDSSGLMVPPRWTPEEFMSDVKVSSATSASESSGKDTEVSKPEPSQHAPLVDCIRTRWPRAICSWLGDPPSIV
ncbi:EF-hand domain pair [Sesbania bispinosa]|nr:EF-hand domain pair [Sesbania bispinosa]